MKKIILSILIGLFCVDFAMSQNMSKLEDALITESGWGEVKIGASMNEVENVLGKPKELEDAGDCIYADYDIDDVLIIYSQETKKAEAIIFSKSSETKFPFFRTDKGISFYSTEKDVLRLYGEPKKVKDEQDNRKLYYNGIIFNFRKEKLHAILIQDKTENKFL